MPELDPSGGGFDVDHLPYGSFRSSDGGPARLGVRLGGHVLDLAAAAAVERPDLLPLLDQPVLNPLLAAGPDAWADVRGWLLERCAADPADLPLRDLADVELVLPFAVGDFVDFYASEHHAANVGRILRPGSEPLFPNWKHLPVSYHSRAGSVVVSGTPVRRPRGQSRPDPDAPPTFGPSRRLDVEAELGFVVGRRTELGSSVAVGELDASVFGVVGLNDWSARDLQAWESAPLGPHLAKSFATTISAWVTPLAALAGARCAPPPRDVELLPHLDDAGRRDALAIDVEIEVDGELLARTSSTHLYWTPAQMLAHLTSNGAALRPGDLYGSGTISGPSDGERGCLLELFEGRRFLDDGARVVLRYSAVGPRETTGSRLTLGEVVGVVIPAAG